MANTIPTHNSNPAPHTAMQAPICATPAPTLCVNVNSDIIVPTAPPKNIAPPDTAKAIATIHVETAKITVAPPVSMWNKITKANRPPCRFL